MRAILSVHNKKGLVPLDAWVKIDVHFPPKKTRPLIGKLSKKGRAEFKTAFADELVEM